MPNILKTHKKGFFEFQTITFGSQRSPFVLQRRPNWSAKVVLWDSKSCPFAKKRSPFPSAVFAHPTPLTT